MRIANIEFPEQINHTTFIQEPYINNIPTYNHPTSHLKNTQFHEETTNLISNLPNEKLINQLSFFPNQEIANISNEVENELTKCSSIAHQDQNQPEDPHMNPILSKIHKKGSKNLNVLLQENDMILYSSDESLNLQQNEYEKNFNSFSVQLKKTESYKLSESEYAHEKPPEIEEKESNIQNHEKLVFHQYKETRDACIQVSILKPASEFRIFESSNISNLSFLELPSEYKEKPELVIRLENSILGSMAESSCFASRNLSRKSPQNRISPRGRIKMPHLEHLESIHTVSDKEEEEEIDESFAMEESGAIINNSGVIYEPLNIGIGGIKEEKSMDFRDHIKEGVSEDLLEYELPLNSQKIEFPEKCQDEELALIQNTFILQKLLQFYTMNKEIKEDLLLMLKNCWEEMESGIREMVNRCSEMISYKNVEIERIKNEKNRIEDELDICRNKLFTYEQNNTNQHHNHILTNKNYSFEHHSHSNPNHPSMHLFDGLKIQISQPKLITSEKENEPKEVSPFSKNGQRVKLISVDENRKALSSKIWVETEERGEQLEIWRSAEKRSCNENGIKTIKRKIMKEHY